FWIKNAPWISRMFEDPEFVQLVKERYSVLYNDRNRIIGHIAEKADHLKYSVIEDNNKWQTLYNATWPNYAIMGNYDNEVQYLKDWLLKRMDWLNTALQ
ncbi:MAG: CotH kinase family protein, partial [Paludibacteraceae bacterium]|nr:CotH kinase family protein [Paludibacteraceae bacterium]